MKGYEEEEVVGQKIIPALTPDYVVAEIKAVPLIHQHWIKNTKEQQQNLVDAFMRMPSKSDGPGFIYGFRERKVYNSKDQDYWIKMGRTKRTVPQDRIFQWEKTDHHQYNEIFTIRSEFNIKIELLVQLLFDYARKPIKINDKLRIQWFHFDQKVPTAAITNLLNLTMEKIHEKFIDKMDQPTSFPIYESIMERLLKKYKPEKEQFKLVVFGLPKTGKTTLSHLLAGNQLVGQKGNKLIVKGNSKMLSNFIEISEQTNFTSPEEAVQQYFSTWQQLSSNKILPLLVIKQSDIESSKLVGLIQGLNLLHKYMQLTDKLLIVVTHCSSTFTPAQAKFVIEQNKQFLSEQQFKLLLNGQFLLMKKIEAGSSLTLKQASSVQKVIQSWSEAAKNQKQHLHPIQFKMQEEYLGTCHEIIQKSYLVLQQTYADLFKAEYDRKPSSNQKEVFLENVNHCLEQLKKEENQKQSVFYKLARTLSNLLNLKQEQQIQTFLYVFCQFCSNKTMQYSLITALLMQQINEKIINVNYLYLGKLDSQLETFIKAITNYCHKNQSEYTPKLIQVMDEANLAQMIEILKSIVQEGKKAAEEQISILVKATDSVVKVLVQINHKIQKGFRLESALGKMRQAIYYGLKGQKKIIEEVINVDQFTEVTENTEITEKQSEISSEEEWKRENVGNLAALNKKIVDYKEGSTILNITKEFSIESPPEKHVIKHNIFILAKEIKVYKQCSISFKGVSQTEKKKLNFILLSENYSNLSKFNLPSKSQNGDAYALVIAGGQIKSLRNQAPQKLSKIQCTFETLRKLYQKHYQ